MAVDVAVAFGAEGGEDEFLVVVAVGFGWWFCAFSGYWCPAVLQIPTIPTHPPSGLSLDKFTIHGAGVFSRIVAGKLQGPELPVFGSDKLFHGHSPPYGKSP